MKNMPPTRKGARKISEIPPEILQQLNQGTLETANLIEWLAIDFSKLIQQVLTELQLKNCIEPCLQALQNLSKKTAMQATVILGKMLYLQLHQHTDFYPLRQQFAQHPADAIRCIACYLVSFDNNLTLLEKLNAIKPFAADSHFGVRELAWMAMRADIAQAVETSLIYLNEWTQDKNEGIRRFASESTRPRGVWCQHIELLKQHPELALPLLNALKNDSAVYVQNSVANWLNDASKSQPAFVQHLCDEWLNSANCSAATRKIISKARRTLDKKA